ncbi:MAG: cation:proton antiporter [Bacteroidaceae bacterium]|nr:cation:proton antiporter [Bacteroidaceae bacterium]
METLPNLISDLAYILIIAGCVTVIFKRLRQPLVLGYIVAGFLAGPHMPYTPSITDGNSISDWSEIGVIFLMFTLGLEFSFKKIMRMGMQPILATLLVMMSMISIGSATGFIFGWNGMDRLFLGGMLAMSSTTIIYKAFEDLGMRNKRFATGVLSTLIMEDLLGILLMVMLSAMAVSKRLEGIQLITSFLELGFFLIVCFVVGIFLVPLIFRRHKKYINEETLLIISVGLCLLLVVIASRVGYSPAFGAFMMGSILSETMESERIEHTMTSLRNLFGAIFFVSVGMLVDPQVLLEHWSAILAITLVVILGQMIFGSVSFLLSGSTLQDAMRSGFSLVQIGEFAFIIAALGESLGVTSSFLYPVVVAVSIITTFFTPYIMRMADPAYQRVEKLIPMNLREKHTKMCEGSRRKVVSTPMNMWKDLLIDVAIQTVAYCTLCVAMGSFCISIFRPLFNYICGSYWSGVLSAVVSIFLLSTCIRPIIVRRNNTMNAIYLRKLGGVHLYFYYLLVLVKFLLGTAIVFDLLYTFIPVNVLLEILLSVLVSILLVFSRLVKFMSIRMERIFTQNLRFKDVYNASRSGPRYGRRLRGKDMRIASVTVPLHSLWSGKSLSKLHLSDTTEVYVVAVVRGGQRINIPGPAQIIYSGDVLEIVGNESSIALFRQVISADVFTAQDLSASDTSLSVTSMTLSTTSVLTGKTLAEINMRSKYNCLLIGIEDAQGNIQKARANNVLKAGDILWVVGEESDLSVMRMCV